MTLRVLIVEDNEDHLFFTKRALNDLDVQLEIDSAADGEEALNYVFRRNGFEDRKRPHLVLLDLRMPRVDGFQVLEKIKSDDDLRTIPVVVLTSSDRPDDIDGAYRLGGNSYVTKPVGLEAMREGMKRLGGFWMTFAELPVPPD